MKKRPTQRNPTEDLYRLGRRASLFFLFVCVGAKKTHVDSFLLRGGGSLDGHNGSPCARLSIIFWLVVCVLSVYCCNPLTNPHWPAIRVVWCPASRCHRSQYLRCLLTALIPKAPPSLPPFGQQRFYLILIFFFWRLRLPCWVLAVQTCTRSALSRPMYYDVRGFWAQEIEGQQLWGAHIHVTTVACTNQYSCPCVDVSCWWERQVYSALKNREKKGKVSCCCCWV